MEKTVYIHKDKIKDHPEELFSYWSGTIIAKDKNNKKYRVLKDDERILSGELVHNFKGLININKGSININKGSKWIWLIKEDIKKKVRFEQKEKWINLGWIEYINRKKYKKVNLIYKNVNSKRIGFIFVNNQLENLLIKRNELEKYLKLGWVEGMLKRIQEPKKIIEDIIVVKKEKKVQVQRDCYTEEVRKKMSESKKISAKGENNPCYGTCFVYLKTDNLIENKRIKKEELNDYLEKGWVKGRKLNNKLVQKIIINVWVHKGDEKKIILKEELEKYINDGWKEGMQ